MTIKIIKSDNINDKLIYDIVKLVKIERKKTHFNKRLHNYEYYKWKLKDNPFGAYVAVYYSNEVLMGFCTFTAKSFSINNNNLLYELGDVYVSSQVRGRGYFFRMLREFHKKFPEIKVYGTPNDRALPSELKVGYKELNMNIKYSFMPIGIPLFHFLYNKIFFAKFLFQLDFLTRKIFLIFALFNKNYKCEVLTSIYNIDSKLFSSSLFKKNSKYLNWRYASSPENYKYLTTLSGKHLVIYKNVTYKKIPFIFIVDHNLDTSLEKKELLKQLVNKEKIFGIFEMTASDKNSFLPKSFSFKLKKIKFITYGQIIQKKSRLEDFSFCVGDTDNI